MRKIVNLLVLTVVILGLLSSPSYTYANKDQHQNTVDVIIKTNGKTDIVIENIERLGGVIQHAYDNAPVISATIPSEKVLKVVQLPNVDKIAKDRLITLDSGNELQNKPKQSAFTVQDLSGIEIQSSDPIRHDAAQSPEGYAGILYSGAMSIWSKTNYGEGSVVAVVDTGTAANACLAHAVTGAPGFPDGYNATDDGIAATDPKNHWHGTHVGGAIASTCRLYFKGKLSDPLYQAVTTYLPWDKEYVPIYGQAPYAKIYPVKVFDSTGSGSPTSIILKGLDHLLTLKRDGLLDIDVVNLSFGGPTWYDGRDILDTFLEEFRSEQILVVTSAGNSGPMPNSLGSPATSFDSIAVGALDYAEASRVLYEYLWLKDGLDPGQGMVMRPTDETRVANLSSRGPMSDGHIGPDISALGMWNFQVGPMNELYWASGTSFSAAVVSGAAALLNAHYESENGLDTPWLDWRNSLLLGADRSVVGPGWQDFNTLGYGALDAAAALKVFESGNTHLKYPVKAGKLRANILGNPENGEIEIYQSGFVSLDPGKSLDSVFSISPFTSKVIIEVYDITTPDNFSSAFWPNGLVVQVQSAKRTDFTLPINQIWYPHDFGDAFTIEIEDGPWTLGSELVSYQPMEHGLMKVSLSGDFSNESPVSFKMRVTRENYNQREQEIPIAKSTLKMGDIFKVPVEIPSGVSQATFDLVWKRDWNKFPTSDIDMLILNPVGQIASYDGATGNTPERAIITDPEPGLWTIYIEAIEVYKTDQFSLYLKIDQFGLGPQTGRFIPYLHTDQSLHYLPLLIK